MPTERPDPPAAAEASYLVRGDAPAEAIAASLQALLPTRQRPLPRRRVLLLDTFDGRVRRTGGRLTRRGPRGSTIAWQPRRGATQVTARLDQPVGFAWDLPDGPLQQGLAPVIGVRRLLPQAEAEAQGSLLEILDARGKTVARLRIESGRVRSPRSRDGWRPLPTVITLTGLRGYEAAYRRLVPVIESRPGVEACVDGLHEAALRQVEASPSLDPSAPDVCVALDVPAERGARQIHQALLRILVANEPGLRANLDTEFLHDFRVAVRRTRALLRQIRQVFPPALVEQFTAEFAWIGRLTGSPRDLDVLVLSLRGQQARLPSGDVDALAALLAEAQRQEHERLVEALDSDRYRRLLGDWAAFLEQPAAGEPARNAARPLVDVVSKRAWRLSRGLAASAAAVGAGTEPARLHAVRIQAKKLRYLVDVSPAFYDAADLDPILAALKKLQRVLGDFNDAHVQEIRLLECGRTLGHASGSAGALLALGRLAEQSRQRGESLRGQIGETLDRFRAPDITAACRRAFKAARTPEPSR